MLALIPQTPVGKSAHQTNLFSLRTRPANWNRLPATEPWASQQVRWLTNSTHHLMSYLSYVDNRQHVSRHWRLVVHSFLIFPIIYHCCHLGLCCRQGFLSQTFLISVFSICRILKFCPWCHGRLSLYPSKPIIGPGLLFFSFLFFNKKTRGCEARVD